MNDNYIPDNRTNESDYPKEETQISEAPALPEEPVPAETENPTEESVLEAADIPAEDPSVSGNLLTEEPEAGPAVPIEPEQTEEGSSPEAADAEAADSLEEPPLPELLPAEAPMDSEEHPVPEETPAAESFSEQFFTESASEEFITESFPELIPDERAASDEEITDIILDTLAEEALASATNEEIETLIAEDPIPEPSGDDKAPAQMHERPEDAPVPRPRKERPARKGRPKRRKGDGLLSIPHMLATVIWLLIIFAIGTSLGRIIWVCAADVLAFGRESREVSISVTADDTMESIAEKLHSAGLINIPELFLFYADIADVEEENKITTGTFTLNTIYDYNALVNHMGPRATNRAVVEDVLIPEGYSCRQIFALLEEKGICKASDLEAYAASGELDDYWFLEGVERGHKYCLEGYLFPDTYDFYENSTPKLALEKMLDGFQYRFTQELRDQLPVLNERLTQMMRKNGESDEFIAENQLTLHDLLSVASMIEKETGSHSESYRIASVIYNRLFSWGDSPRYLGIDATIIYALDGKIDLTAEDLAVDSPYNTRNHEGLPPGPICNPGLASIEAALNPEDSSYYYYVVNPETGTHMFAKTLAEHNKNVEKYKELLQKMEQEAAENEE